QHESPNRCDAVRALVAGGAGFLGSHLVDRLLAEGHDVDVVDNLSTGSLSNLAAARATASGALHIHHLDVLAPQLGDLVVRRRPDLVYQLTTAAPGAGARAVAEATIVGVVELLEAA